MITEDERFALVIAPHAYLRSGGSDSCGIEDEVFSGWALRLLQEENEDYVQVETHYGYVGYVRWEEIVPISRTELMIRQNKAHFSRISMPEVDLLDQPKVQGLPLELLMRNSIVEVLDPEVVEGWSLVRSAAGQEGYIHTDNMDVRMDSDGHLLQEEPQDREYIRLLCEYARFSEEADSEELLREKLVRSAKKYLGTQYRWGGKSSQGIDCSGLVFMSYMENGILIWRDAQIKEGYPIREIPREQLKKGDLIFFPGHVAMYLGDEHYIHSTGYNGTPYVTINSLREQDRDCRRDLIGKITGYGSIFV